MIIIILDNVEEDPLDYTSVAGRFLSFGIKRKKRTQATIFLNIQQGPVTNLFTKKK